MKINTLKYGFVFQLLTFASNVKANSSLSIGLDEDPDFIPSSTPLLALHALPFCGVIVWFLYLCWFQKDKKS